MTVPVPSPAPGAPTLKRALSFRDLVVYGMVFMVPIAPFSLFGYVDAAAQGRVPLAYALGLVAMLFSALSYAAMAEEFPVAGSAYAYVQRGLHPALGFAAGWLLLLDYILVPALLFVISANSLAALWPAVPKALWVLGFLGVATAVNLRGVEMTARANQLFLLLQLAVLGVFLVAGLRALYAAGAPGLTLAPVSLAGLDLQWVAGAAAIAALSFLGFDGIATLSEELHGDAARGTVGRSMLVALFGMGALFMVQTWVAADLVQGRPPAQPDTAFYELAGRAGGPALFTLTAVATALASGLANALAAQSAVARILFAMGRDQALPASGWLAALHPVRRTPQNSTWLVAAVSLAVSALFLDHGDTLANVVTFGALCAFSLLHVACAWHFLRRQGSGRWVLHGLVPALGLAVLLWLLYGQDRAAMQLGGAWLAVGVLWWAISRWVLRRQVTLTV